MKRDRGRWREREGGGGEGDSRMSPQLLGEMATQYDECPQGLRRDRYCKRCCKVSTPSAGLEPATFEVEVQYDVHCAKRDMVVECEAYFTKEELVLHFPACSKVDGVVLVANQNGNIKIQKSIIPLFPRVLQELKNNTNVVRVARFGRI